MASRRLVQTARLTLEPLERRDVPSAGWAFEEFEVGVPRDWELYSTDASQFTATSEGLANSSGLKSIGASTTESRAWLAGIEESDLTASVAVRLESLVPATVFVRGSDLDTTSASYYGVNVTRGTQIQLVRVLEGQSTVLAEANSAEWINSEWVRVSLTAEGDQLRASLFRIDTGQYLNADGIWQGTPADVLSMKDTTIAGPGRAGLARPASVAGGATFDRFEVGPALSIEHYNPIHDQRFDRPSEGTLPPAWKQWYSTNGLPFSVEQGRSLVGPSALSNATGNGVGVARAWLDTDLPPDMNVSTSVYLDSLIPAQLITRGQNLDTDTPTFYSATLTRGLNLQLTRVVDGQETILGEMNTQGWQTQQWVHVEMETQGNLLSVLVYRPDTAAYLDSAGNWVTNTGGAQVWAMQVRDDAIRKGGAVGVGRGANYAGTLVFDNFSVSGHSQKEESFSITEPLPGKTDDFADVRFGSVPRGWQHWATGGKGGFQIAAPSSVNDSPTLIGIGGKGVSARLWQESVQPADVEIGAALYTDGVAPAELLLRGSALNTLTPTYHAASVGGDGRLAISRVIEGTKTDLAIQKSVTDLDEQWLAVRFRAEGDLLSLYVQRQDTGEYLNSIGTWTDTPSVALWARDGSITKQGSVGVGRPAGASGRFFIDHVRVSEVPTAGAPPVTTPPPVTAPPVTPPPPVTLPPSTLPPPVTLPPSTPPPVVVPPVVAPPVVVPPVVVPPVVVPPVVTPPPSSDASLPAVPRRFDHIRVAQLAYSGTPFGSFEQNLAQNAVDLIVPNPGLLDTVLEAAPDSANILYTNFSNIYLGLLTDWLAYADAHGYNRESAFFHVTEPTRFTGSSSSSIPVNQFWSAQRSTPQGWENITGPARTSGNIFDFAESGHSMAFGTKEKFREINVTLARPASPVFTGVWEYVSAVDADGQPTQWSALPLTRNSTANMRLSGTLEFDPPADWVPSSINGGASFYYVRLQTLTGTPPTASRVLGRDYVNAGGLERGTIPAFDHQADLDGDGYLNDAEYARRRDGFDARFEYESRLFYPAYGQNRFAVNPSDPHYREWAVDYARRFLDEHPRAVGYFVDNSPSRLRADADKLAESLDNFNADYSSLLGEIQAGLGNGRFLVANTAGAGPGGETLAQAGVSYLEEFGLRPLASNWSQVEDLAALVQQRNAALDGRGFSILDSLPRNGDPTDPRTQLATMAYYYLLADPDTSMLMLYGGHEPSTSWTRHWFDAIAHDVGRPVEDWSEFATGSDPSNRRLSYKVFGREYDNALVLYKPLSYHRGTDGTLSNATKTVHNLGGTYRELRADGTLGSTTTRVSLRNGEGAILIKV